MFDEKDREIQELKQKYLNAVADYETTMAKKEQLNSLVNSCREEIRQLKKLNEEKTKIGVADHKYASQCEDKVIIMENQQKEFIKYLEEEIKIYSKTTYMEETLKELEEILQKYKEIIGVSDGKTN